MTTKSIFKTLTGKLIIILLTLAAISFSAFFLFACGKDSSETTTEKTYQYKSEDTSPISNMNFDYATEDFAYEKFPYTTSTWSRKLDNGSKTSQVNSGIIDISEDGWKALTEKLFNKEI